MISQAPEGLEIIVIDNGSRDDTAGFVKKNYSNVILIENRINLGACKARNQGIEISKGSWVMTLDSDVVLGKDFFAGIHEAISSAPGSIGIIQPKILKEDRKTIYSAGIHLSFLRRFYDIGKGKPDGARYFEPAFCFGACSACAIYRRKMLDEVKEKNGYFDEKFFFLVEDVDLSWRAQRKGWKTIFYPAAACYHFGNSSAFSEEIRQYLCFYNRYAMIKKNEGLMGKLKLFSLGFFYDAPRIFYIAGTNKYFRRGLKIANSGNAQH